MSRFFNNEKCRKLLTAYPVKALDLLYDHFYRGLYNLAWSLTLDPFAAEDVLQETFMHVWENRKALSNRHDQPIEKYLVRVVKYKSITQYKRSKRENQRRGVMVNGYVRREKEFTIEEKIIREELVREIKALIATFPRAERECLLLCIEQEMSTPEIATKLKVTVKAVERSLSRANKRLRAEWLKRKGL